jgi:beta-lactamase regulating signal transducer with metallopeptidase domain/DNA gyrase inhibitor GyrI
MPIILKNLAPFFSWLLQTSWQATVLAALILVLQRLLRRFLPPAWSFGLWLILLAKLLLPVSLSSQLSLFNFVSIEKLILNDQRVVAENSRQGIGMGISGLGEAKQDISADSAVSDQSAPISLSLILTATWLIVVIVLLGRTAYVNIGVLSHARKLRPLIDGEVLNLLENCKSELRVHVPVSVVVTEKVQSPALLGFIRPRLLLPEHILQALTPAELRHVFLHELAHVKRLDIFCSWLVTFLQILHWFNPILWFAFNRMRSDLEIACDSLALSTPRKNQHYDYARTIIKVLELTAKISPLPGAAGILEDKDYMKRRISKIGDTRLVSKRWSPIGALLVAGLGMTALTNPVVLQHPEAMLERMKVAYERQDVKALMAMYASDAVYQEIGPDGKPYSTLDRSAIENYYRFNLSQNPKFNYSDIAVKGDTLKFHGALRSGLFEVIGLYEVEGDGQFVLRAGLIVKALWREVPDLKQRRLEIFNNFVDWLKTDKPQEYASMFSHDLFVMHRASGEKINELFLEWVATNVNTKEERRMVNMSDLPEVKQVRLDKDIIAICKEFRGPYADAPKYVTEVQNYLNEQKIAYLPYSVLGIYFDDPNQPKPEGHRSYQGVLVEKETAITPPNFVYKMKKGDEYLYTKVVGKPEEVIPAGYMALFNYMGVKKIQAGSTGGHQVVTMEDGKGCLRFI